jgi:hypothetical protein
MATWRNFHDIFLTLSVVTWSVCKVLQAKYIDQCCVLVDNKCTYACSDFGESKGTSSEMFFKGVINESNVTSSSDFIQLVSFTEYNPCDNAFL